MFNLKFEMHSNFPRLAWCAHVARGGDVLVRHGPWVETRVDGFFEGAWDGDFESFDFPSSVVCLGSGAQVKAGAITFAAPSHTLENLFVLRRNNELLLSNSLAFILVEAGDSCTLDYPLYQQDLVSIVDGLDKYIREIPTTSGSSVELYYHCNLVIDTDLSIAEQGKPEPDAFKDYDDYFNFLRGSVRAASANACDSTRQRRYRPLTTVSSGYDSPAAAVLALEVGCDKAITFADARGDFSESDDSGLRIGEHLSLSVTEFERTAFMARKGCTEAEFLANGKGGQEVIMSVWDEVLPECLLFTGFHGDRVWGTRDSDPSTRIVRGDTSGGSLTEFRLRLGFVHFSIPFLGCVQYPAIQKISNSAEMRPWVIEQSGRHRRGYSRPIPRRMVEDQGVDRDWFGQTKKAAGHPAGFYPRELTLSNLPLAEVLSEDSLADFNAFSDNLTPKLGGFPGLHFSIMRFLFEVNRRIVWRLGKYPQLSSRSRRFCLKHWRYQNPLSRDGFLFHWGLGHVMKRYQQE